MDLDVAALRVSDDQGVGGEDVQVRLRLGGEQVLAGGLGCAVAVGQQRGHGVLAQDLFRVEPVPGGVGNQLRGAGFDVGQGAAHGFPGQLAVCAVGSAHQELRAGDDVDQLVAVERGLDLAADLVADVFDGLGALAHLRGGLDAGQLLGVSLGGAVVVTERRPGRSAVLGQLPPAHPVGDLDVVADAGAVELPAGGSGVAPHRVRLVRGGQVVVHDLPGVGGEPVVVDAGHRSRQLGPLVREVGGQTLDGPVQSVVAGPSAGQPDPGGDERIRRQTLARPLPPLLLRGLIPERARHLGAGVVDGLLGDRQAHPPVRRPQLLERRGAGLGDRDHVRELLVAHRFEALLQVQLARADPGGPGVGDDLGVGGEFAVHALDLRGEVLGPGLGVSGDEVLVDCLGDLAARPDTGQCLGDQRVLGRLGTGRGVLAVERAASDEPPVGGPGDRRDVDRGLRDGLPVQLVDRVDLLLVGLDALLDLLDHRLRSGPGLGDDLLGKVLSCSIFGGRLAAVGLPNLFGDLPGHLRPQCVVGEQGPGGLAELRMSLVHHLGERRERLRLRLLHGPADVVIVRVRTRLRGLDQPGVVARAGDDGVDDRLARVGELPDGGRLRLRRYRIGGDRRRFDGRGGLALRHHERRRDLPGRERQGGLAAVEGGTDRLVCLAFRQCLVDQLRGHPAAVEHLGQRLALPGGGGLLAPRRGRHVGLAPTHPQHGPMVDRLRILPGLTQFGIEAPDHALLRAVLREQTLAARFELRDRGTQTTGDLLVTG